MSRSGGDPPTPDDGGLPAGASATAPELDDRGTATRPPREVDARGLSCPRPVIELAAAVASVEPGTVVRLTATDPAVRVDVPVWCRLQRHQLLARSEPEPGVWRFDVQRSH